MEPHLEAEVLFSDDDSDERPQIRISWSYAGPGILGGGGAVVHLFESRKYPPEAWEKLIEPGVRSKMLFFNGTCGHVLLRNRGNEPAMVEITTLGEGCEGQSESWALIPVSACAPLREVACSLRGSAPQ